jgi:hypothetical protein
MMKKRDEFLMREPLLLLQGHLNMPVRSICFDQGGTVEAAISHFLPNVPIKTTLWLHRNVTVQIAIFLILFQFANNNERFSPLIVVVYYLPLTVD